MGRILDLSERRLLYQLADIIVAVVLVVLVHALMDVH